MMFKKISQNFVKSALKFCFISQILVHSLWHVCMAYGQELLVVFTMVFPYSHFCSVYPKNFVLDSQKLGARVLRLIHI